MILVARIEPIVPEVEQFDDVYDALTSADAALLGYRMGGVRTARLRTCNVGDEATKAG